MSRHLERTSERWKTLLKQNVKKWDMNMCVYSRGSEVGPMVGLLNHGNILGVP